MQSNIIYENLYTRYKDDSAVLKRRATRTGQFHLYSQTPSYETARDYPYVKISKVLVLCT